MSTFQDHIGLAANANAHVYGLEGGKLNELTVTTDGSTWPLIGKVPVTYNP